jgi:hypothetical protein
MVLHAQGASSIPTLISQIDDSGQIPSAYLANPTISYAYFDSVSCGAAAAYLIEWLLSIERPAPFANGDFFLGVDSSNYPYRTGRLTKGNSDIQIQIGELPRLRAIYSIWWEANKKNDISTLRHDWATGKRPLAGSIYSWH